MTHLHEQDSTSPPGAGRGAVCKRSTVLFRCTMFLVGVVSLCVPSVVHGQTITLAEAVRTAESHDRSIWIAELERDKALRQIDVARTRRWPTFSITALGSQPLTQLGITLERGSLGVYPFDGPIPGHTTTLESPLRFGFIGYASVAQPLTQQHEVGLGIALAEASRVTRVGVIEEQIEARYSQNRLAAFGIIPAAISGVLQSRIPLALHGGPLWEALCYAQIGGLTVATAVTLLVVPVFYAVFVLDLKVVRWDAMNP